MFYKTSLTFFLFFSCISVTLLAHNTQRENEKTLLEHLNASNKVIAHAPEAIKGYEDGKLYIDESQVCESDSGSFLSLSNGKMLSIPLMSIDSLGAYLNTLSGTSTKIFTAVCNVCNFAWEPGVFDVWCPNCNSTNWGLVARWRRAPDPEPKPDSDK